MKVSLYPTKNSRKTDENDERTAEKTRKSNVLKIVEKTVKR